MGQSLRLGAGQSSLAGSLRVVQYRRGESLVVRRSPLVAERESADPNLLNPWARRACRRLRQADPTHAPGKGPPRTEGAERATEDGRSFAFCRLFNILRRQASLGSESHALIRALRRRPTL